MFQGEERRGGQLSRMLENLSVDEPVIRRGESGKMYDLLFYYFGTDLLNLS